MNTDDLIARLSAAPAAKAMDDRRLMALVLASVVVPVAVFLTLAGVRHGLGAALADPMVLPKTVLPTLAFALALPELARLARPEGGSETRLFRLALPLGIGLLFFIAMLFSPGARTGFLTVGLVGIVECLGLISLLAIVPVWAGLTLLRQGAVAAPGLGGAVAGFVAGSGAAAGYSLFCTRDNPLFYLFWYGLAIGLATLVGALIGRRRLQW